MLPSLPEGLRLLLAHIYPSPLRFLKPSFKKKKKAFNYKGWVILFYTEIYHTDWIILSLVSRKTS